MEKSFRLGVRTDCHPDCTALFLFHGYPVEERSLHEKGDARPQAGGAGIPAVGRILVSHV